MPRRLDVFTARGRRLNFSLNEVEALVKKACRGSKLNWGASAETAKATRWLIQQGQDPLPLLLEFLRRNDSVTHESVAPINLDEVWQAPSGALSPVMAGLCLTDLSGQLDHTSIEMKDVSAPLLMLGFLGRAAGGRTLEVTTDRAMALTDGQTLALQGDWSRAQKVSIHVCHTQLSPTPTMTRAEIDDNTYQGLDEFCQRTYAPATEASRQGAGAGLTDND